MKRICKVMWATVSLLSLVATVSSCGKGKQDVSSFPAGFSGMDDAAKVKYMMSAVTPDSVARFLCDASLGRIEGVRIDTLSMATLYAYEHYEDDDLQTFQIAYDAYADNLPLADKMRLRKLAASDNPDALGYQLGLEYVNDIRTGKRPASEIEAEIGALKSVCDASPEDSLTFERFMKGFKIALDYDGADGIPRQIYNKYK